MFENIKGFLFTNRTIRQTVAKNAFWLGVSNIGGRLLRAVIIIYAARVLGAAEWGVFSYAVTLAAFLTVFVDLGINHVLTRETAKTADPIERARLLSTTFYLKIPFILGAIAVIVFLAPRFTAIEAAKALFPIVALIVVFDALREFGFALTRALEKMEWEAGLFLFTNAAIVVAGFISLADAPRVESFTYAYAAGTGIGMVATFFAIRKYARRIFSSLSVPLIKPILLSAWPFAVSGLLGVLMVNTDILIIGWLRSAEDVGLYSAALRIIQLLYILPAILASSALPMFSRLARVDDQKMRTALTSIVGLAFLAAVPLALGGTLLGEGVIRFIFGNDYAPAGVPFQILMTTMLADFPAVILSNAIFAYNSQKNLVAYAAIGGIANVALDFLLIPPFGIIGSAWATLFAQVISNIYLWRAAKRITGFEIAPRLKNIILASAGMGAVSLSGILMHLHVVPNIFISAAAYFGILHALKDPLLKEIWRIVSPLSSQESTERTTPF